MRRRLLHGYVSGIPSVSFWSSPAGLAGRGRLRAGGPTCRNRSEIRHDERHQVVHAQAHRQGSVDIGVEQPVRLVHERNDRANHKGDGRGTAKGEAVAGLSLAGGEK